MKSSTIRAKLELGCRLVLAVGACWLGQALAQAGTLSMDDAVAVALAREDPSVSALVARADALDEKAVADRQLPDPEFRFGFANWPVDTFDFEQEPMTQIQAGLRQSFPRGRTLAIDSLRRTAEADIERARASLAKLEIALEVREAWLELFYWFGAQESVQQSADAVGELVEVVQASFATGLQSNQDLLRAELELALLDDRAVEVIRQIDQARADLGRYVGAADAGRPLSDELPELGAPPSRGELIAGLVGHPAIQSEDARIDASEHAVGLAEQQYLPGWMIDVGYGVRSGGRADFASVMVSVEVPLFTERRQDRRLAGARSDLQAAQYTRAARLLDLRRMILRADVEHARLAERIALYQRVVVQRAEDTAEAALDGYQSQVTDFAELIRSRLALLDATLKLRRLRVDHAKARARLLFLAGKR